MVEISSTPETVRFPTRNASGTDTQFQFAAIWTPKNYLMHHSSQFALQKDTVNAKSRGFIKTESELKRIEDELRMGGRWVLLSP